MILNRLTSLIASRRNADPAASYVANLFAKGPEKIAQKFGEEAVETLIAALKGTPEQLVSESADMLFHWLVLLESRGVVLADVLAELERREGTSGLEEKAGRK